MKKWFLNRLSDGFNFIYRYKWPVTFFIYGLSLWIGWVGFDELLSPTDDANSTKMSDEPLLSTDDANSTKMSDEPLLSTDDANSTKISDEPFYGKWYGTVLWAFINSVVGSTDDLKNGEIVFSQALAYLSFTFVIIIVLFKAGLNKLQVKAIANAQHSLVIGLGQNNRQYLESEIKENKHGDIIIIETDEANPYIEDYRREGFGVYVGTFESFLKNRLISSTWSYCTLIWINNRKIVRCLLYYRKLKWINNRKIVISLKKSIQKKRSSKYVLEKNYLINLERIMIATGNDRININLATKLADCVPDKQSDRGHKVTVHMHVENFDYNDIFYDVALKEKQLEFKPFSFNDDTARQLFEDHTVLGNFRKLVGSNEAFSVAIVGSGNLAERVIYHLCLQANLPNKNRMDIHCISQDADQFIKRLRTVFYGMKGIEQNGVTLYAHTIHFNEPEFYTFFNEKNGKHEPEFYRFFKNKKENLTNVFICFEDEDENLQCAVSLYDNVFRKEIIAKDKGKKFDHYACDETNNQKKCTKILFAAYNNMQLSKRIHDDKETFNNFKSFGDSNIISSRPFRVDEIYDGIAKLIHAGYTNGFENISKREEMLNPYYGEITWYENIESKIKKRSKVKAILLNDTHLEELLKEIKSLKKFEDDQLKKCLLKLHNIDDAHLVELLKEIKSSKTFEDDQLKECLRELQKIDDTHLEELLKKIKSLKELLKEIKSSKKFEDTQIKKISDELQYTSKVIYEDVEKRLQDCQNHTISDKLKKLYCPSFEKYETIEDKWNNIDTLHKRHSNRSQALHINTKLMAMGFRKEKREKKDQQDLFEYKKELFIKNKKIFKEIRDKFKSNNIKFSDEYLESLSPYSDEEAKKNKFNKFIESILTSDDMISKLARAEHERWNTFHYLEGWEKGERNDPAKVHNCLKSFDEFDDDEKKTIVYDVQSVLDIPFYLAHEGYEIVLDD